MAEAAQTAPYSFSPPFEKRFLELEKKFPKRSSLVLWSLHEGLDEFPESPPPGLVTVPNIDGVPKGYYTLSGYHPAGVTDPDWVARWAAAYASLPQGDIPLLDTSDPEIPARFAA